MTQTPIAFYMHDLSGGGVERMRLSLIAELRSRGLQVCLIVGRAEGALAALLPDDLEVVSLDCQGMLGAIRPLARVLARLRPQILFASLDHNNVTALLAGLWARTGTPIVICQHNALSAELDMGWKYRAIPWLYWALQWRAQGIIAVSQGVADDLATTAGIPRARITPIYNPVIDDGFAERAAGPAPHLWLKDGGAPVCIFAGRLTPQKNPSLALHALALLDFPVRLLVLGEGPSLVELQTQVQALGLTESVAYAGFQTNPLPWIARAACLLSTSRYEGLGNVLIEALALGVPVISTDCPHGPSEILLGGQIGALVPVGEADKLAQAITATLLNPPAPETLKSRAAAFSAAACADAHLGLLKGLGGPAREHRSFGLTLSALGAEQVVDRILSPATAFGPNVVVTPNIDHIRLLRRARFRLAYRAASLACPDGFPVLAYARLRGLPLRQRVTGCGIFARLAERPELAARSVLVIVESSATQAAVTAWAADRGLTRLRAIAAPEDVGNAVEAQEVLIQAIQQVTPDILVMTLGAPTSEMFLYEHRDRLPQCWALCVGQAVRVHLGLVARAPSLWQRLGLEWAWRVRQEPRRLTARYLLSAAWFPLAVLGDLLAPAATAEQKFFASFFQKRSLPSSQSNA